MITTILLFLLPMTAGAPTQFAGFVAKPEAPNFLFRKLGVTSASTEFGHLVINFDLRTTRSHLDDIRRQLPRIENALKDRQPHHSYKFGLLQRQVDDIDQRLTTITLAGSSPTTTITAMHRGKRFVFAIGALALGTLISLAVGMYAAKEVVTLEKKANALSNAQQEQIQQISAILTASTDLASVVDKIPDMLNGQFDASSTHAFFNLVIYELGKRVTLAENAVRAASFSRLDITTISAQGFTNSVRRLRRYAAKNGLTVITRHLNDFLHVPVSTTTTESGFAVVAHIPLIDAQTTLEVYQHVPLPMPAGDDFFFQLEANQDIIAISPDKTVFKVMSTLEITTDCTKLGNFFACPRGNAVRKPNPPHQSTADPGLCLYGIFTGNTDMAATTCTRRIINPGPQAAQTSPTHFITYGRTEGNITCRSAKLYTTFETSNFGNIVLPPGCTAHTDAFVLSSGLSDYTRDESEWVHTSELPSNASLYLRGLDTTRLRSLAADAHHALSAFTSISLTEAQQATEAAANKLGTTWDTFSTLSGPIALALALLTTILWIYTSLRHRGNKQQLTTTPQVQTFVSMGNAQQPPAYMPPNASAPTNPMHKGF